MLVKNLTSSPQHIPTGHLECAVEDVEEEIDVVSLADIRDKTVKGVCFRNHAIKNKMHCLMQRISVPDRLKARTEDIQEPQGLPVATDLDEAAETEEGLALDSKMHKTVAETIPWDKIEKEYHAEIRELLVNKYPEIVSQGFWDTGDTSKTCLLYTSPSPRDKRQSRMPSSA